MEETEENRGSGFADVDPTPVNDEKSAEQVRAEREGDSDSDEGGETEYVPAHVLDGGRDFRVEGNDVSGYLGVDPEYMTYANETERPHLTDQERYDFTDQYSHLEGNEADEADEAEVDSADKSDESGAVAVEFVRVDEEGKPVQDKESSTTATSTNVNTVEKNDGSREQSKTDSGLGLLNL